MAKPKVAIQGGGPNYLGKQPTVSGVPKKWKSSPDHPTAELAYITKEEKDILIDLDLYGSLKGKPNKGPGGLPSLQGDMGSATQGGMNSPSGPSGPVGKGEGPDRRDRAQTLRQQRYPGILQGERIPEYRQRMAQQKRQAAIDAERKAREAAAKKAQEEAARQAREQAAAIAEQQRLAQEEAARQAAAAEAAEAARLAQEEAARQAAAEAARVAEQQRLAAIEEQRRRDAEQAELERQQRLQHGTQLSASLNRPASPSPRYQGYTPMDYDASKTGSLTDAYARMLNVPFFQPFIEQTEIQRPSSFIPGTSPDTSIFGIDSLMPTYQFNPTTQTSFNPFSAFGAKDGGRVGRMEGGMMVMNENGVVNNGISSILNKYKQIRSEL
jgi:hypothetical protein